MIVFILVPGLYAAVEQADDPALRGRPVIVGGDPAKRGTVTGASREARARVLSQFTSERMCDATLSLYRAVHSARYPAARTSPAPAN